MAKLNVDVVVNNEKSLLSLKDRIENIDKSTKKSMASFIKWGTILTFTKIAIGTITDAGRDYQKELDKITGITDDLTKSMGTANSSFGQFSQRLMEVTTATEKANMVLKAWDGLLLHATSLITGESIPALIAEQEAIKDNTKAKKEAIKYAKQQIDLQKRANKLWYESEKEDELKRIAEAEAEGFLAMMKYNDEMARQTELADANAKALKERLKWAEKFAMGRAKWEAGSGASNLADFAVKTPEDAIKENTQAVIKNTDVLATQWSWQVKGLTAIDAIQRDMAYKKAGMGSITSDLMNENYLKQIMARGGGSGASKTFGMVDTTEDFIKALEESLKIMKLEQKARLDQIKALEDSINALQSISNLLGTDHYGRARESLFGGTKNGRSFAEAKANAKAAWDLFQTDTSNEDFLKTYNKRMDELIGTLDEFKDWTKFDSKAQQTFAKHKALRDVKDFQDGQLKEKEEVDLQLEELRRIKANTETTYNKVNTNIAKNQEILDRTKANDTGRDITGITSQKVKIGQEYRAYSGSPASGLKYRLEDIFAYKTSASMGTVNRTGYKDGGYTGDMGVNSVAGMVHGQEYVLNAQTTRNLGLNDNNGGTFNEIASLMYEQLKTTKKMHSIEKQMLQLQREVA